jgi:FkbM family methyltransferase
MVLPTALKDKTYKVITALAGDKDQMVTMPVLSGPGKGLRFRGDLIKRKEAYIYLGRHERPVFDMVMPLVKPGWVVWDCGTYLGYYTAIFARSVGPAGQVIAIEMDKNNLARTKENATLNRLANVQFVNAGIGAPLGVVEFILDGATNSHLPGTYVGGPEMKRVWEQRDAGKKRERVEVISLDQALLDKGLPRPNLIKIDIDGSEKDALQHASHIFEQVRPLLILELHNAECDRAAWDFSRQYQYQLKSIESGKIIGDPGEVSGTVLCTPLEAY